MKKKLNHPPKGKMFDKIIKKSIVKNMKNQTLTTIIIIILLLTYGCYQKSEHNDPFVEKNFNQLIHEYDPNINIGVVVKDLTDNKFLYKRNADRYFIPASNLKLFTTAAALIYLGPEFRYQTSLSTNAQGIQNHELNGDLYLQLNNDPTLTSTDLSDLFLTLKKRFDIRKIKGNLIITTPFLETNAYNPGWLLDDLNYGYAAPIGPFIIDQNQFSILINPNFINDKPAIINVFNHMPGMKIKNQLITVNGNTNCQVHYVMDDKNDLQITGCIEKQSNASYDDIAIRNPTYDLTNRLTYILKQHQVKIDGKIVYAKPVDRLSELAVHTSPNLSAILNTILKESNNTYAESILLTLGQHYFKKDDVSWQERVKAMTNILHEKMGIDFSKNKIVDGAGLSRYNLITPSQIIQLLQYVSNEFTLRYEFINALPVAGGYGTLKNTPPEIAGLLRAKTGSMSGITSLSGYLETEDKHLLAFAILINGFTDNSATYRALQYAICKFLISSSISKNKNFQLTQNSMPMNALQQQTHSKIEMDNIEKEIRQELKATNIGIFRDKNSITVTINSSQQEANLTKIFDIMNETHYQTIFLTYSNDNFSKPMLDLIHKLALKPIIKIQTEKSSILQIIFNYNNIE
jgi:D-alanyl-D-alanine carboxypeptidase/D-alanyl-D-alanine-endopeptidase (penicillin-binding protein 4)